MPIVYCLVARGVVVECDVSHPLHSGNFKLVALKLLHKVHSASTAADATATHATPTATKRQTLLFDAHTFNFLSLGSLHCLALCTADVKQHTAFLFLADALDTFQRAAGGEGEGEGERAQQQQSQQGGRLEAHKLKAVTDALTARMEQYNSNSADSGRDGAGEERSRQHKQAKERRDRDRGGSSSSSKASKHSAKSSKQQPVFTSEGSAGAEESAAAADELGDHPDAVRNVKRELESVKDTLLGNIDRVLSRGEALESLVDRSDALHSSADQFKSASTRLHRQLRWQQIRTAITLLTMAAIIVYFMAASRCGVTLKSC